jgi:hypothetical protein
MKKKFEGKGTLTIKLDNVRVSYQVSKDDTVYGNYDKADKTNPHYKLWYQINNHLKRRGFTVTVDPDIYKNYRCLSKDRRCGIKNDLEFKTERHEFSFSYEFFQNLNFENTSGGYYDFDKYQKMPYRLKLTFRNEMMRMAKYAESIGVTVVIEKKLSDIEEIIASNNINTHIHGTITCLEDIKGLMKDYDISQNSSDKNKKLITCGDTKCFYDYNNKIAIGQAYHHINNMWWVIVNGKRYNIASFYLFDQYPGMPKKKPLTQEEQVQRIHTELKKAEAQQDYERCIVLRNMLKEEKLYYIYSLKHGCWWGGNNSDYTSQKNQAGVYRESVVLKNPSYYNNGETTRAILKN